MARPLREEHFSFFAASPIFCLLTQLETKKKNYCEKKNIASTFIFINFYVEFREHVKKKERKNVVFREHVKQKINTVRDKEKHFERNIASTFIFINFM